MDKVEVSDLDFAEAEEREATKKRLSGRVRKENKKMKKKVRRMKQVRGHLIRIAVALLLIFGLREFVSYTNIEAIAYWRTLYIETAMTTHSHQWLATLIFPKSVIEAVVSQMNAQTDAQQNLDSSWSADVAAEVVDVEAENFFEVYWELDSSTFRTYLENHPELIADGYDHILLKDLNGDLNLFTVNGDPLLAVDTENNFILIGIDNGLEYQGKLALVKNPAQVEHVLARNFGTVGEEISSFGERLDALVAINADPFDDPEGHGSGGNVLGSCIVDGREYGTANQYMFYGMQYDNRFYISSYSRVSVDEWRWGIQFFPAMIVDGENVLTSGSGAMGLQPRTCIGQTEDGTFMFLIVDGRQPTYSVGTSVAVCADIMQSYGAYQAANLDGGSSAVMWYDGELITRSSSASGMGRYCPDALIINRVSNLDGGSN